MNEQRGTLELEIRFSGMNFLAITTLYLLAAPFPPAAGPGTQGPQTIAAEDFGDGWRERWLDTKLASRPTRFSVLAEDDNFVLQAESERSAAALWLPLQLAIPAGQDGRVAWRWKVKAPLLGNHYERQKEGDDYAARFFVIFDAEPFSRAARALCYVWAASEAPGSVYRNPFFPEVATVVLQSGDARTGRWVAEARNFVRDYRKAFGEPPGTLTGLAVMVDTDNTRGQATAWFDDIDLRLRKPASATPGLGSQVRTWPSRVLLTNDDGITAEGLRALAEAFAPVAETYVVAPLENRSASTNYVSAIARRGIEAEPRDLGAGVTAYAVDGYPADAVVLGLQALMRDDPPDLVISGVNPGPNLSDDWNPSGTVGAARMAAFLGVPAIAVSGYPADDPETLAAVGRWVVALARSRLVRELEPGGYLTVSVPRVAASEIRGATITRRGPRPWALELERDAGAKGESGREHWDLRFVPRAVTPAPGTDTFAYSENRIAVVLMRVDEHDYPTLERLLAEPPELPAWPPAQGAR